MWIWTSSALLAALLVSGLSFPNPDREYKIPEVGNGDRSQFYVLHRDGTFKYGYDSGDGAFESVKSHTLGNLEGKFGYVDPEGNSIKLEYEAGQGGFVARGDHLPKPSPELAQAIAAALQRSGPFVDPLAGSDGDKSYGFKFQSESHSRDEQANEDGTVTGSYSYVDEDGVLRSFTYRAGKGIGFIIEGDGLTQESASAGSATHRQSTFNSGSQFSNTANVRSGTHSQRRRPVAQTHVANTRTSSSTTRGHGSTANVASTRSGSSGNAAYSFNYNAGDHSRAENSDSNLNIDGSFSFVADDGNRRTVNYQAGSGNGFTAQGAHLPVAPEVPSFGNRLSGSSSFTRQSSSSSTRSSQPSTSSFNSQNRNTVANQRTSSTVSGHSNNQAHTTRNQHRNAFGNQRTASTGSSHSFNNQAQRTSGSSTINRTPSVTSGSVLSTSFGSGSQTGFRQTSPVRNTNFEEANIRSISSDDGSYSFSYDSSSNSRSEAGDSDGNVDGNFRFNHEGNEHQIAYEAGSDTGFIAKGSHIPVGPEVPGAVSGQPTGDLEDVEETEFIDPLAGSKMDRSYAFEFESDGYSRTESADEDGNVVGTYTVVDDSGLAITYQFRAGKGIGFETTEIRRVQGAAPVRPTPYSGQLAIEEAAPFDVPGTPNFPSPGQSNYVHPHPTSSGSTSGTSFRRSQSSSSGSSSRRTSSAGSIASSGSSSRRTHNVGSSNVRTSGSTSFASKHSNRPSSFNQASNVRSSGHGAASASNVRSSGHGATSASNVRSSGHGATSASNVRSSGHGASTSGNSGTFQTSFRTGAQSTGHAQRGSHRSSSVVNNVANVRSGSQTHGNINAVSGQRGGFTTSFGNHNHGSQTAQFKTGGHSSSNNFFNKKGHSSTGGHNVQFKSSSSSSTRQDFPSFNLNTYEASPDAHKFGYVLKFD